MTADDPKATFLQNLDVVILRQAIQSDTTFAGAGLLRIIVSCSLLFLVLSGCGASYHIEPGRLLLVGVENLSVSELRSTIGPFLDAKGFDDLGLDEEMISLMEKSAGATGGNDFMTGIYRNRYTYLNERRDLSIVLTDYTDATRTKPSFAYVEPVEPFIEISVYESRPGGMSAAGQAFFADFQANLERTFGAAVVVATQPPETDVAEYWTTTLSNLSASILWWSIVFGIVSAPTALLFFLIFRGIAVSTVAKRGLFVLFNTWLATPLPFPAATILVILLPNLFAFPWTDLDYYQRVLDFAVISFPISLILSSVISIRVFRVRELGTSSSQAGPT